MTYDPYKGACYSRTRRLRPYGLMAVKEFTMKQIHAANPSKGWSMQNIQAQAAKEFPLWSEQYVYDVVRSAIFRHCNL